MARKSESNELKIMRIYDAPVQAVWDAWTDPEQVGKWWGPRGFTLTTHAKDFRPGGFWKYTMHGPDGTDYENRTIYHEVEPLKKLVYDHGGSEDRPPLFRVTVLFTEQKSKTKMDMTMTLPTPEAAAEAKKFIKRAGGNATWDRLAEFVEKERSGKETFVINRSFEAPIHVLFEMWTDPTHFSQWLAPVGMNMTFLKADIRPGGESVYSMSGTSGLVLYGKLHHRQIEKPHRIVYSQQFSDEKGGTSRHPMMPVWPETMLTTVQLTEEGPEETRVTVTWEVEGPCTPAELAEFVKERGGMTQGWTGSFDKLEEYLEKRKS